MTTVDAMGSRCPDCGDVKRLGPDGRCAWRAGCEHRQMVEDARLAELDRMLAPVPAEDWRSRNEVSYVGEAPNDFSMFAEEFAQIEWLAGGRVWWENGQWYEETWGDEGPPPTS